MKNIITPSKLHSSTHRWAYALLASVWCLVACQAKDVPQASPQPTAQKVSAEKCSEGGYSGPQVGARSFNPDPYLWFVSPAFAKRFCLPEKFIDTTLKGALAIAVRIKPNEDITCGFFAGRTDQCYAPPIFTIDVYVDNKTTNIPKADPSVVYYSGKQYNSESLINTEYWETIKKKGIRTFPVGERRPFSPAATGQGGQNWISFQYAAVRKGGWASHHDSFIESYYRANWVEGIDLISLGTAASPDNSGERYNPDNPNPRYFPEDPIIGWAIAIIPKKDIRSPGGMHGEETEYLKKSLAYPSGYSHVIELPLPVARLKHAFNKKNGEVFFNDIKRAMSAP